MLPFNKFAHPICIGIHLLYETNTVKRWRFSISYISNEGRTKTPVNYVRAASFPLRVQFYADNMNNAHVNITHIYNCQNRIGCIFLLKDLIGSHDVF